MDSPDFPARDGNSDPALTRETVTEKIQRRARGCIAASTGVNQRPSFYLDQPLAGQVSVNFSNPKRQDEPQLAPSDENNIDDPQLLSAAAAEFFRMRRARDNFLPSCLTGEPAWDMLLALYSEETVRMTVSSVCHGSGVPHSTAMRWIAMLEREGLVAKVEHPRDEKLILLSLTRSGRLTVERALRAMLNLPR